MSKPVHAACDYPLRFVPLFRRYLWGGRRLGTVLGKPIGPESDYAESWEIVDHGVDQSVVSHGPLAGTTLHELVAARGTELFGQHVGWPAFPLLFKFLDAQQDLSVQVHPNDAQAQQRTPPDLGKTEAWVVMDAEPDSLVYAGLKRGFDRHAFERELRRGTTTLCLHAFHPQVDHCIFIPAGTVHALGKGLLIAEIQQSSDVTFRLDDWNRVGADRQPRTLHIEDGLSVIDFERGPVGPQVPSATSIDSRRRLVACDKFVLDRWESPSGTVVKLGGDHRFHILAVTDGRIRLAGDSSHSDLTRGQTALLPAAAGTVEVQVLERTSILDAYLP